MGDDRGDRRSRIDTDPDVPPRRPDVDAFPEADAFAEAAVQWLLRDPHAADSFINQWNKDITMSVVSSSPARTVDGRHTEGRRTATFGRMATAMRECATCSGYDVTPMD
jgi:hypothetical protein